MMGKGESQLEKEILHSEKITLYGKEYDEITYIDGDKALRRYDHKSKMWVTSRFAKECSEETIQDIKNTVVKVLTGVV